MLVCPVLLAGLIQGSPEARIDRDLAELRAKLTGHDLSATGKEFYRAVDAAKCRLRIPDYDGTLRRIRAVPPILLVDLHATDGGDFLSFLVLLWSRGNRVQSLVLHPYDTIGGWSYECLRLRGSRIVGCMTEHQGTSPHAVGIVLQLENGMWRYLSKRLDQRHEISSARFAEPGDDSLVVDTRADDDFTALTVPHAGPHLVREAKWRLVDGRYRPGAMHRKTTALTALDQFCEAYRRGMRGILARICPNPELRSRAVRVLRETEPEVGRWSPTCVGSQMRDEDTVFGFGSWDSVDSSTFFEFKRVGGRWQIVRIASERIFARERHFDLSR